MLPRGTSDQILRSPLPLALCGGVSWLTHDQAESRYWEDGLGLRNNRRQSLHLCLGLRWTVSVQVTRERMDMCVRVGCGSGTELGRGFIRLKCDRAYLNATFYARSVSKLRK